MISLHPIPRGAFACPRCGAALRATGWRMPGMRLLAETRCQACATEFLTDMPASHGLLYPASLEPGTGRVHGMANGAWFADWLAEAYAGRDRTKPPAIEIARVREVRRPLVLNCLDARYGHCLLKLLNAQYHLDHHRDHDLIVLIPRFLRWMVPDGVAETWTVEWSLHEGAAWSDVLDGQLHERLNAFDEVWLSRAVPHPRASDVDVTRFTRVRPFALDAWARRLARPAITFVWREDDARIWAGEAGYGLKRQLVNRLTARRAATPEARLRAQQDAVGRLAQTLRRRFPTMSFAVVGLGQPGGLPEWIQDRRVARVDDQTEADWCRLYAESHLVIGTHGSNMLLPTAHAGATIVLVPPQCWRNVLQDVLLPESEPRRLALRCRCLPVSCPPADVALVAEKMLRELQPLVLTLADAWNDHEVLERRHAELLAERRRLLADREAAGNVAGNTP